MWRSSRFTDRALAVCLAAALAVPVAVRAQDEQHCHTDPAPARQAAAEPARYTRAEGRYEAPDVTLIDAQGARVPLRAELAREGPVAVQLVFTTCTTICPVLTGTAAAARAHLPNLRWLSITIDPDEDTPERLRAYAARFRSEPGAEPGSDWRFLTGRAEDLVAVQQAFDAYRGDKMRHEPLTLLRAAPGGPWARLQGFPTPEDLAAELKRLAVP
jgi:protein SCO1